MTQPFLHNQSIVLQAPVQCWSRPDGQIVGPPASERRSNAQGVFCGDDRVVSSLVLDVTGRELEHIATDEPGGPRARYEYVVRTPELGVDPLLLLHRERHLTGSSVTETYRLTTAATHELEVTLVVTLTPDATPMAEIKSGRPRVPVAPAEVVDGSVTWWWRDGATTATLSASGGELGTDGEAYRVVFPVTVPARGEASVSLRLDLDDAAAPFVATTAPALRVPEVPGATASLTRLLSHAFLDLGALRLAERGTSADAFLAAGSPWFFTLFGRDSLIASRLLLPTNVELAASTLRVLAARQGREVNPSTAEQPGKILHEVRRVALDLHDTHQEADGQSLDIVIPPEYFGTIDATTLWILLLADAADAGMPDDEVRELLPALWGALGWLRDHADADGDGFIEYFDESGHGLANQGWKDSGDSIRWANGDQAEGPIALVEVQGYAYAAAMAAARLLERFDSADDAGFWRSWAARLSQRFRERFWVSDELGPYPALALDVQKRPVDGVSSNIGHLLGTGILDADEARAVVRRLMHPSLASGYGVRTLSTTNAGYWPLGYHVGSVWTHDTAVIIDGMLREGFREEAGVLAAQVLRAAEGFGFRMPELFGGEPADRIFPPQPYPAACRPQAWAAASAVVVARALHPEWSHAG
ncbi:MAG TPA: glycogen debranching N-terminal domain-containing protein [Propionibacteriaceae bacterium]|nr:glycogen debranching N-terminal domain-containing protein [Propionibacteriaceae bacterium]